MLQEWLNHKVTQIRLHFDHQELSEHSLSTSSSSNTSTSTTCSKRSRSQSHSSRQKTRRMTPKDMEYAYQIIEKRRNAAFYHHLMGPEDPVSSACIICLKRIAKFIGDNCLEKHGRICKYCMYTDLVAAFKVYNGGGSFIGSCKICSSPIAGVLRRPRRHSHPSDAQNNGDENVPETEELPETSVSFQDFVDSWVHEAKQKGRVNRGYESSSSF